MRVEEKKRKTVTSRKLAANDVEWALKNGYANPIGNDFFFNIKPESIKVIGINEDGNKARIFVEYDIKQKTLETALVGSGKGEVELVRLNSGEWLFPSTKKILKK